jgi:hypothetical protein
MLTYAVATYGRASIAPISICAGKGGYQRFASPTTQADGSSCIVISALAAGAVQTSLRGQSDGVEQTGALRHLRIPGTTTFLSEIFPTERPTTVIGPLYHAVICPIFTFTIHLHLLYIVIWFTTILVPHAKAIIRLSHTAASQSSAARIFGKRLLSEAAT